jgi:Fur family ferric uptake transcriptional regulator
MTCQRRVILEELRKLDTHPSADELYAIVRRRLPRISLGTVYRNLEVLTRQGEIQKLELCGSQKRFDGRPDNHYHIRCSVCGRVIDAPVSFAPGLEAQVRQVTDFKILGHKLEFIGICPHCQQADSPVPHLQ